MCYLLWRSFPGIGIEKNAECWLRNSQAEECESRQMTQGGPPGDGDRDERIEKESRAEQSPTPVCLGLGGGLCLWLIRPKRGESKTFSLAHKREPAP